MRKRVSENVYMIIDNCAAYGDAVPELERVEYNVLPPNFTLLFQLMEIGIIAAIKRHARRDMLSQLIQTMDNREELQRAGKKMKQGTAGLK